MSTNKYTWRQEQQMLEDSFARALLVEYNIREVTTQRQAKNGTREFEFPVPSRKAWPNSKKLRLACYKTGYVRNTNSCSSTYQLNPTYDIPHKAIGQNGKLYEATTKARMRIWSRKSRLKALFLYTTKKLNYEL